MKRFPMEERHLLLGGGCALIVLVAALVYGVLPVYKANAKLAEERDRLERLTQGQDLRQLIVQADDRITGTAAALEELLASDDIVHLESHVMSELELRAQAHRLKLTGIKPVPAEGLERFEERRLDVRLEGGFFDIFDWLAELESALPYIVVRKLHIFNSGAPSDNPALNLHVTVSTYRKEST